MEFPIFFLASVVCIALFFLFRGIDNEKYEKFVRNYSVALKELQELNKTYRFFNVDSCKISHTFDNEKMFRQIECQDYLIYQLQFEQGKIIEQIKRTNQNARIYNKYLADVKNLCRMGIYEVPYGKLKREKLMEIEKKIYKLLNAQKERAKTAKNGKRPKGTNSGRSFTNARRDTREHGSETDQRQRAHVCFFARGRISARGSVGWRF